MLKIWMNLKKIMPFSDNNKKTFKYFKFQPQSFLSVVYDFMLILQKRDINI